MPYWNNHLSQKNYTVNVIVSRKISHFRNFFLITISLKIIEKLAFIQKLKKATMFASKSHRLLPDNPGI